MWSPTILPTDSGLNRTLLHMQSPESPGPVSSVPTRTSSASRALPFHVMTKPIGARCNLECRYCYYLEKEPLLYPDQGVPRMDDETLECFVRDYIAAQPPGADVVFAWQGGEPTLLGLDFFKRAVALQKHYAGSRKIQNAFQTNGTLLDDKWAAFFRAEDFLIGISFDGPGRLHDQYRVDRSGRPTWDKVRAGLSALRRHGVAFNTLTVVNRRNCNHALDVYRFLVDAGSRHLQFIPLVERRPRAADLDRHLAHSAPPTGPQDLVAPENIAESVTPECAPPGGFGKFLRTIFDHWVRHDVGRVFVQQFDSTLSAVYGMGPTVCVHQPRCGRALALEHNGNLYACDHYVYPEYRLGNIRETPIAELANGPAAARLGDLKADLSEQCRKCPVRFACNGDCPKHRFVSTGLGRPGLSYLCEDYHGFFTHVQPAMRAMAELLKMGRAPSEIMRAEVRRAAGIL